ncbi:unnamed protein product [Gongylonema pulchrum]|uniref:Transmembrane protein n=1 Tax=Gongylonema pulchrum TaxID=637853 RepID=A0A183CWM3_9BILA|nr:unnamed protein product [Gongylonema pulchrum]
MGAAVILLLLIIVGLGVAYHMGILEPYIKEAQARLKQGGGGGGGGTCMFVPVCQYYTCLYIHSDISEVQNYEC